MENRNIIIIIIVILVILAVAGGYILLNPTQQICLHECINEEDKNSKIYRLTEWAKY